MHSPPVIRLALINTQMIQKQVSVTNEALHRLASLSAVSTTESERRQSSNSVTTSSESSTQQQQPQQQEDIADLLIDRVTFKKYRCCQEECRKTFDDANDLYSHIASHVSEIYFLDFLMPSGFNVWNEALVV
jgi:uncharacterized Zn-finger protein